MSVVIDIVNVNADIFVAGRAGNLDAVVIVAAAAIAIAIVIAAAVIIVINEFFNIAEIFVKLLNIIVEISKVFFKIAHV